jgi:hypothetical protein
MVNTGTEEEIAASVGAHRDLGGGYDDAIAAGLVERIGAEVDRRVDERMSLYQRDAQSAADGAGSRDARRAAHPGSPVAWQQTFLAFGSMVIGAITSGVSLGHGESWPILFIWFAIVVINLAIFRVGPFRPDRPGRLLERAEVGEQAALRGDSVPLQAAVAGLARVTRINPAEAEGHPA